ncbi:reverse transcriptase domain-containing protein [Geomicrobium halophilum]|uniref:reverse transcriptase domain-containing protein n=1 Tax=Geomicrobium halophilum TaxID=549000 RepID=UPI0031B5CB8A
MARIQTLINTAQCHFVVDIDIKSFFDHINHTLLIKQLWNMGVRDRTVLVCISEMLKAEIDGEGKPTRGVQQGSYANLCIRESPKSINFQYSPTLVG